MGTQKNRLYEMILLSNQNTCVNWWIKKESQFYAQNFCSTGPMIDPVSAGVRVHVAFCAHSNMWLTPWMDFYQTCTDVSLGQPKWDDWVLLTKLEYPNYHTGSQIRVCNWKLFFLFLKQNICCGYSKEPSQWNDSFEQPKDMCKLMDKKIIAILL